MANIVKKVNTNNSGSEDTEITVVVGDESPSEELNTTGNTNASGEISEDITLVDTTNKPLERKNFRIKMRTSHKCCIGGVWYHLEKGQCYNVPENVKTILTDSDLLLPL